MNTSTAEHVEVRVDSARHGILVTRLNPGHYRISLSEDVPVGLTRERIR
ncbi:MAG: hypothetical protein JWQ75_2206 [Pseudarthrobacter sp.]|nr:hypothetical protein [Pseudarthrobacter sp.]